MIRRTFLTTVLIAAVFPGGVAFAHQQKVALTEILFNSRTGNIEVAHRFIMHDAEHAARQELGIDGDLYGSLESRTAFAEYVAARFSIATPEGAALPLSLLGTEIKDGYLWVYQETPAPEALDALAVRCDALRDVWPDQVNRVNVKRSGEVRTLIFAGAADVLLAVLKG